MCLFWWVSCPCMPFFIFYIIVNLQFYAGPKVFATNCCRKFDELVCYSYILFVSRRAGVKRGGEKNERRVRKEALQFFAFSLTFPLFSPLLLNFLIFSYTSLVVQAAANSFQHHKWTSVPKLMDNKFQIKFYTSRQDNW